MQKQTILIFLLLSLLCSCQTKTMQVTTPPLTPLVDYQPPIPFQPEKYVCHKTTTPLTIDGEVTEKEWELAVPTNNFVDIEGALKPLPAHTTYAKMLWDDNYFYIAAKLEEPHIWATLTERDAVIFQDDDFEVFIDPDGDGHNYYEFEVNALNTVWDLILLKPYRIDNSPKVLNNWEIKGLQCAVHIAGTLNDPTDIDQYWTVEMAFPWSVLKELSAQPAPPKEGHQWRVNFSRVDWTMDILDTSYQKRLRPTSTKPLPENNWVWSPQGRINMHHPETWGYVQFSEQPIGKSTVSFKDNPEEQIKWALWQLHFQQIAYFKKHQQYCNSISALSPIKLTIPNYTFAPILENYTNGYQLIANSISGDKQWVMNEEGKIVLMEK